MGRALGNPFEFNLVVVTGPRNGCPECDPIVGKVFSISGLDGRYPALSNLDGGPPFHDDCCHNISPFVQIAAPQPARGLGARTRPRRKIRPLTVVCIVVVIVIVLAILVRLGRALSTGP